MKRQLSVATALFGVFCASAVSAQLQGSIRLTGEVSQINPSIIDIAGQPYNPQTEVFEVGNAIDVTITWNISSTPVGMQPPGATPGVFTYELDPNEVTVTGQVGGIPLSGGGPITLLIANDVSTVAVPTPFDIWTLSFGSLSSCPLSFEHPTTPTVNGGIGFRDATAAALSSNEFQWPTVASFSVRRLTVLAGAIDPGTQACLPVVATYAVGDVASPSNDLDGDGVEDALDNCPSVANADQLDANGDGYGDACVSVTGFISDAASVGPGLILGELTRIIGAVQAGENLSVGDRSWVVGPNLLGDGVSVGTRSLLSPGVAIGDDTTIGDLVLVSPNVDIGSRVAIEDRVVVLPRANIGSDVTIGGGVLISAFAVIGDGAVLGDNVVVGAGAIVAAGAVVPSGTRIRPRATFQ